MEVIKNAKFQCNISKIMPARPKHTGTWNVNRNDHPGCLKYRSSMSCNEQHLTVGDIETY